MVGLLGITLLVTGLSPATAGSGQPPSETTPSFAPRDGEGPEFVPGELLVRYEPGTPSAGRASARQRHRLTRVRGLPLVPGLELVRARGPGSIPQQAARVSRDPAVRYAEPNFIVRALGAPLPNDPEFGELWGLHNTGQTGGTPDADIDAPEGWQLADASHASEIVVGVIDTGIDINHPDLEGQIWENPDPNGENSNGCIDDFNGCDFTTNPPTGDTVFNPLDGDDHGTHVAGTIAATMNNDMDVAGVSQAKIMPIKFLGPDGGTTANAIRAIDYAIDNGADITNNSWGGGGFSQALKDAIERANDADQLFIAAAGNDGKNLDQGSNASYPASYDSANIVAVAATTHTDALASFSNYGKTSVDLGAPGASILSTVPRFGKAILTGPDTGGAAYRSAFHTFGLEGVPSAPQRQAVLGAALGWMGVGAADPILVVDDDGGQSFQTVYQQTLTALGHTNITTFTVPTSGSCTNRSGPTAGQMASHDAVIWFTGSTFSCTLNSNDRTRLTSYLGGGAGRNLLLFGQDIGFDLTRISSGRTFLRDILRGDFVADYDLNFRLAGEAGTPYAGVGAVVLDGRSPSSVVQGQLWSSAFEPRDGAVAGLRGAPTTWFDGTSMAAPHVTGAAAQVMARFPYSLDHLGVKARLMDRGDATSALAGKTVSGRRLNLAGALEGAPAAPTGLTATAGPGGVIDLAWTASTGPDVAGYRVYRGTTSGSDPTLISGGSLVTGTSYQDADTADGTTYFYVVRGVSSSDEEGGDSNQASATADATPPTVASTDPDNGATLVPIDARVGATFSEPMDPESIAGSTFVLRQGSTQVAASVAYDAATMTATLTPDAPLEHLMTYTAEVTTGVTDLAGNQLAAPFGWTFETTGDTEAPSVHIDGPQQNALVSRSDSLTITGSAEDNIEVTDVEVAIRDESGAHWDGDTNAFVPGERWRSAGLTPESGTPVTWDIAWAPLPSSDAEIFTILVRARDAAGNRSEPELVEIVLDNVAPKNVTTSAGPRYQRQRAFPVSWSAEDNGGVESFLVQRRAARFNGGWGSWTTWQETSVTSVAPSALSEESASFRGRTGSTYCFRTRAWDEAGNGSSFGPPACTAVPLNNTQLAHVRSWRKRSGVGGAYLGTFSRSTQRGARLVRKGIQAKRLAIVVTRCPKCGTVAIRWRGKLLRRIDLRAPTTRRRQVIAIKSFPAVRQGNLVVVVTSRGRPVIVEGLATSRV